VSPRRAELGSEALRRLLRAAADGYQHARAGCCQPFGERMRYPARAKDAPGKPTLVADRITATTRHARPSLGELGVMGNA